MYLTFLLIFSASKAWNGGLGEWPQMSMHDRIKVVQDIVASIQQKREEIANVLVFDICKTVDDALLEVGKNLSYV